MNGLVRWQEHLRAAVTPVILVVATVVLLVSLRLTVANGPVDPVAAVVFGLVILAGELVRLTLPGGREGAPVALAAATAYAVLAAVPGSLVAHDPATVITVTGLAGLVACGVHRLGRHPAGLVAVARRVVAVSVAAYVVPLSFEGGSAAHASVGVLVGAVCGAVLVDLLLGALVRAARDHAPVLATLQADLVAVSWLALALISTALLLSFATPLMGVWAAPVFAAPLVATQFAFRRHAAVRRNFRQTIRSMSRVTEVGGYTPEGHSARVAELAVQVGRDFGMADRDLLDLEYAALMHDIGQLSLTEAIPGGSPLGVAPLERRRIASLGADIVRSTGRLDRVAEIVDLQSEPYRRPGTGTDPEVPLASRIVKAASAYDDLVTGSVADPRSPSSALEQLRLSMAYEYDPAVVASLSRIVARR